MTAGPSSLPTDRAGILALCDGLLREVGRREHRFSWLRQPDGGEDEWLSVDAYYPSNRVVVYAGIDPEEQLLYEELVPQHGLYLLCVDPYGLPDDPIAAQALLRKRLEEEGWSPRPAPRPVAASPARAQPAHWTEVKNHAPEPSSAASRAPQSTTAGIGMGLVLIALVLLEAFLGLVVLALENGEVILGAGLLLDAAARAVATLTAAERRRPEQTWASLLIGSPSIAGQEMPAKAIAIAALVLIALGIVVAVL
jgi:hypothetical protein